MGFSDKPDDVQYPLSFFVECVKQTLDAMGVANCAVVGNSLGGAVAVGLALAFPDLVSRLILLAPGGMSQREEYMQMPAMQKMLEVYAASDGELTEAGLREFFEFGLVYDARHITDALIAERRHVLAQMNPQVMLTMDIPYLAERLSELVCPVLVFWGANDRMMPESGLLAMARHCRAMKLILLSECGHWVMVEHEALFNRECLRFLAADGETHARMTISSIGYAIIESTDPDQWLAFGTEVLGMMESRGVHSRGVHERPFRRAACIRAAEAMIKRATCDAMNGRFGSRLCQARRIDCAVAASKSAMSKASISCVTNCRPKVSTLSPVAPRPPRSGE